VPISTVATLTKDLGPLSVNHLGQLPAVTISFNLRPDVALGDEPLNGAARDRRKFSAQIAIEPFGRQGAFDRQNFSSHPLRGRGG